MTTLKEAVKAVLDGDGTLAGLATGGVHDADSVGHGGMRREVLAVSGQVAINPGVFLKWTTDSPMGVNQKTLRAARIFLEVYFYQDTGYETCQSMRERVRGLLEYQRVSYDSPSDEYCHDIFWRGDVLTQIDEAMGGISMERSRYEILITRGVS